VSAASFSALVAMFLWRRVRAPLRPLLALYPLAMGLSLIATGEHYFFDVLLGWLYAAAVMAAWSWWERRRAAGQGQSRRGDLRRGVVAVDLTGGRVQGRRDRRRRRP